MTKRVIVPGLLAGLSMLIVGMGLSYLFSAILPDVYAEYQNTALFRSWEDPLMLIYFVQPFVTGLVLAWIWERTKTLFGTGSAVGKGVVFALIYWMFSLGGMLISYSSFPISAALVGTWYVSILLQGIAAGIVLAKLNPSGSAAS
jgi:hypothetical protein